MYIVYTSVLYLSYILAMPTTVAITDKSTGGVHHEMTYWVAKERCVTPSSLPSGPLLQSSS